METNPNDLADFRHQLNQIFDNLARKPDGSRILDDDALRDLLFDKMTEGETVRFAEDLRHFKGKRHHLLIPLFESIPNELRPLVLSAVLSSKPASKQA